MMLRTLLWPLLSAVLLACSSAPPPQESPLQQQAQARQRAGVQQFSRGNDALATRDLQAALRLWQQLAVLSGEAESRYMLGQLALRQHHLDVARTQAVWLMQHPEVKATSFMAAREGQLLLCRVGLAAKQWLEAERQCAAAEAQCPAACPVAFEVRILRAQLALSQGQWAAAVERADTAAAVAETVLQQAELAQLQGETGLVANDFSTAERAFTRALAAAQKAGHPLSVAKALQGLGQTAQRIDRPHEAQAFWARARTVLAAGADAQPSQEGAR